MLKAPEEVTGYREVRYPKQDRAREAVEAELKNRPKLEVSINRDLLEGMKTTAQV